MGTPKGNQKGFRYWPSGGSRVEGLGGFTDYGQDSKNNQVRIWGMWTDTGVPGLGTVVGKGFTVTRDNVGIWTVTFDQGFEAMQSVQAFTAPIASGTGTDDVAQAGAFTAGVAGACTLGIFNHAGGVAGDLAAGDYIGFEAVLLSQWND